MADLIDRQELLKHKGNCYDEEGHLLYAVGAGTILLMPTVDAIEVVRCKDCKYCDRGNCDFWDDGYGAIVSMDDFCSWGERREDAKAD